VSYSVANHILDEKSKSKSGVHSYEGTDNDTSTIQDYSDVRYYCRI
jgi:hypothetical protein